MASKSDEYRARAAECEDQAASAADDEVKFQFREFARQWREMAKRLDEDGPFGRRHA
jgi:hypothetical protein